MSTISTNQIAVILQEKYPDYIIVFDNDKGDDPSEPQFHKFLSVDDIINYFNKSYMNPFVIDDGTGFTKENCLLTFNDKTKTINIVYFKYNFGEYTFYDDTSYLAVKDELSKNSMSYDEYANL